MSGKLCKAKNKVAFETYELAKKAAKKLTWKNRFSTGEKVAPYECVHCGEWHVGRGPRGSDKKAYGQLTMDGYAR